MKDLNHIELDSLATCARQRAGRTAYKLDRQKVMQIKRRLRMGEDCRSIAADFNVTTRMIYHISSGKVWLWVDPDQEQRT